MQRSGKWWDKTGMSSVESNHQLWVRTQHGDEQAFALLYHQHASRIFNHCYRRTLSRPDSEDLTAEVFALAWRRRQDIRLHPDAGGLPWLLLTANHLMHRHRASIHRAHKLLAKVARPQPVADHSIDITDSAEDQHNVELIAAVLRRLSRRDREIVQLCVLEGLTPSQVAAASGEPAGSVRSRLSRALVRARREFHALSRHADLPVRTTP